MTYLLFSHADNIAKVTFKRPEALNALNTVVLQELDLVLDIISADKDIRAVIVTGAGEKAFIAGADIKEMQSLSVEEALSFSQYGQGVLNKLANLPQPVIAAINGYALGGGCEVALSCDFRIASTNAVLGQPEIHLGVIPGFGGTQRLVMIIGLTKAKDLIFSGRKIKADEAYAYGLVDQVVPVDKVQEIAYDLARRLTQLSPIALTQAKKAINYSCDQRILQGLKRESEYFSTCFDTVEQVDRMNAFLTKK